MSIEVEKLQRRYDREKSARLQAEDILELKSRELFEKNNALEKLSSDLENQVIERTKELSAARDIALAAVHAKSEFLANMSHELRTPMNGVLGMLMLIHGTDLNTQQKEYLRIAKSSGELLLSVINDILDFSKIDAGKMDLERLVFDPRQVLDDVLSPLRFVAEDKGIALTLDTDKSMPVAIWGDPTRLKQVITNLVSNAVKFTGTGVVTVSLQATQDTYSITVKDTGMGMNPEQITHIFEAFGQGDSSITRTHGGTGLGLTITNRLVQMMKGEVHVNSELGSGSEFIINFPLTIASEAELESSEKIREGLIFSNEPILLVEDNKVNQQIAMELLQMSNLHVTLAENGLEALGWLQKKEFKLVLMDLQMPVMDGIEASRKIRLLNGKVKDIPIIAMTAHASMEHIDECMEVGMNAHATKPINLDSLLNLIAKWINPSGCQEPEQQQVNTTHTWHLPGIDVPDALSRVKGNKILFEKILNTFYENNVDFKHQYNQLVNDNQIKKIEVLLHTLKGSSANLSARSISRLASELEEHAKQSNIQAIKDNIPNLLSEISEMCTNIEKFNNSNKAEQEQSEKPNISEKKWIESILSIANIVQQDFSEAESLIQELATYNLPKNKKELFSNLLKSADQFDMDGIENAIKNSQWDSAL
jgi:two-component system sensor histidine kinase/response regulator